MAQIVYIAYSLVSYVFVAYPCFILNMSHCNFPLLIILLWSLIYQLLFVNFSPPKLRKPFVYFFFCSDRSITLYDLRMSAPVTKVIMQVFRHIIKLNFDIILVHNRYHWILSIFYDLKVINFWIYYFIWPDIF